MLFLHFQHKYYINDHCLGQHMDEMCTNHPDRLAVETCHYCKKQVCDSCNILYTFTRKRGNIRIRRRYRVCPHCYLEKMEFRSGYLPIGLAVAFFLAIIIIPFYNYFTSETEGWIGGPLMFAAFGGTFIWIILYMFINTKKKAHKAAELRVKGILNGTIQ